MSWDQAKREAEAHIAGKLGIVPPSTDGMRLVLQALAGKRLPLQDEKALQNSIWSVFEADAATWKCAREVKIAGGIIDFIVAGDTGVEIKIKGTAAAIARQLAGYAAEARLSGLVLVTAKTVAVPPMIGGKPVAILDLGRAWL